MIMEYSGLYTAVKPTTAAEPALAKNKFLTIICSTYLNLTCSASNKFEYRPSIGVNPEELRSVDTAHQKLKCSRAAVIFEGRPTRST